MRVPKPMWLPGEHDAVKAVIVLAEIYGYGNLISHLGRAWAIKLMRDVPGLSFREALKGATVNPYPENLPGFEDVPGPKNEPA